MRTSSTMRASLLALAVLTLTASTALAVGDSFKIGTAAGTSESDCLNQGGTISTDSSGEKICKLPKTGPGQQREPTNDPSGN